MSSVYARVSCLFCSRLVPLYAKDLVKKTNATTNETHYFCWDCARKLRKAGFISSLPEQPTQSTARIVEV